MPYLYSVRDHLPSLERARATPHQLAVPGHGPSLENVAIGVEPNEALVRRIADSVADLCEEPRTPDEILADLLGQLGADPPDAPAFYLLHPTIYAYLSYLEEIGAVRHWIERGRSLWQRV